MRPCHFFRVLAGVRDNVIDCITRTLCKKNYTGETGRRLDARFREHLRDVERKTKNQSSQANLNMTCQPDI